MVLRDLLGITGLVVAVAANFEITVVSPDDPGLGLARVAVATLTASAVMWPFWIA